MFLLKLLFQLFCVFYGVGVGIVVEIDVNAAGLVGLPFEPFCPALQYRLRIAARIFASCAVEANVDYIGCNYTGRFFAGHIVDAKANFQCPE